MGPSSFFCLLFSFSALSPALLAAAFFFQPSVSACGRPLSHAVLPRHVVERRCGRPLPSLFFGFGEPLARRSFSRQCGRPFARHLLGTLLAAMRAGLFLPLLSASASSLLRPARPPFPLFFLGTLLSGDAGCLFLLAFFGFGEFLTRRSFSAQFGNAGSPLFFLGTLLSGDASGLFRASSFVGALLRSFTLGTCLFLSFACRTFQDVQAVFRIQRQRGIRIATNKFRKRILITSAAELAPSYQLVGCWFS